MRIDKCWELNFNTNEEFRQRMCMCIWKSAPFTFLWKTVSNYPIFEYVVTFRRIVRIGSKPSPLWEDLALSRLHPALLPRQGKALQPWSCAQNRFLRTLQPTTAGFLRHILSRKLTFINPLLQCHWHPFFSVVCRLTQTVNGQDSTIQIHKEFWIAHPSSAKW